MAEEIPTAAPVASVITETAPAAAVAPAVVPDSNIAADAAATTPVVSTESTPSTTENAPAEVKTDAAATEPAKPLLSPDQAPKEEAVKDPAQAETPKTEAALLPVYEFKLPEGASTDNPAFKSFQSKLGEFQNLSKTDQATAQKFGQEMIDMHLQDLKAMAESQNKSAWEWFNNRNKEWLESAKKDPVIGGDNFDSTVNYASQAISQYGGNKQQQIETAKLLQETGLENSPIMLRFLSNITKIAAKEGTPVSGSNAPSKATFNPAQALFGGAKTA